MKNTKGSFSLMKRMNTTLILNLIRQKGGISRIDIAKETGLTAATVTNLTGELLDKGIITEDSIGESTGGRKPVFLKINPQRFYIACAYISPDSVDVAVSDGSAELIFEKKHMQTGEKFTPDFCADFIVSALGEFKNNTGLEISALGLGLHGIVDSERGIIVNSPNLGWRNVEIKKLLEEKSGFRVFADNDVRLMAKAEIWFGERNVKEDFVFLYIGRGVGAAIVSGGEVVSGKRNCAGEIGHTVIDVNGPLCECGKKGCLQALASESAMLAKLKDCKIEESVLRADSSCDDIVQAYLSSGDALATKIVEEEAKYLCVGISNMINSFDPGEIIISSSITRFDEIVEEKISSVVNEYDIGYSMGECEVKYSSTGKNAVLKGAVATVLSKIYENV